MMDAMSFMNDELTRRINAALQGHEATCECAAGFEGLSWRLVDPDRQVAAISARCVSCQSQYRLEIRLPDDAPAAFPLDQLPQAVDAIHDQMQAIAEKVRHHAAAMPAAAFVTHPLWAEAGWSATTFQWHPTSEAPPIMGIVFEDAEAGQQIFRDAEAQLNHTDRFEEICVSIIEGDVPGQEHRPGYTVHICPDPESLAAHATVDGLVLDSQVVPMLGQWNRVYPVPGQPPLLPRFKEEYEKHREFLLAPVVRRDDGQLWCVPELGIIKNIVTFRDLADITDDDADAVALLMPQLIVPPA